MMKVLWKSCKTQDEAERVISVLLSGGWSAYIEGLDVYIYDREIKDDSKESV